MMEKTVIKPALQTLIYNLACNFNVFLASHHGRHRPCAIMIDSESYQPSKEVIESDKSTEIDKSLEIIFQNHAFDYSLGLKEALDLSPSSTSASDDIQLLSLPDANDGHIMIRGGSGAGGFKIQKTLAFSDAKRSIKTKSDTTTCAIKELYLYDILFLTGMGISTWLLRNILKN